MTNNIQPYKKGIAFSEANMILKKPLTEQEIEHALVKSGFKWEKVSPREKIVSVAKALLDTPYVYGASITRDAPRAFDCSSLSGYVYVQAGLSIPRMAVEQFVFGEKIEEQDLLPGDLIFTKGRKPYYHEDAPDGVGHVGIYIGDGFIIHASGPSFKNKVIKEKWKESPQFPSEEFRGFRRLVPSDEDRFVVEIPDNRTDLRNKENLIREIGYNSEKL